MSNDLPSLSIEPTSSRLLLAWWILLYLCALVSILLTEASWVVQLALLSVLSLSGVLRYRQAGMPQQQGIVRLTLTSSGWCKLVLGSGRQRKARLRGDSFVSPWVIILRFDLLQGRGRSSLVVFRDALSEDRMRRLRIMLGYIRF
ncbi:MAG: hypothetical protein P8101_12140 [Candidatus Thiodiazotropha sp.]|jgi:hypothetical protein